MAGSKMLVKVVIAGIIMLAIQSCNKTPVACFNTDVSLDSIHVNEPVTFNATCSVNADSYNWQFYNNQDSIAFSPVVTKVFKDTGNVNIYLLVTGGRTYAGINKDIRVLP